jgi:predicted transposase YbfD/YdcC
MCLGLTSTEVLIMACPKNHPVFSLWKGIRTIGVVTTIRKVGEHDEEMASTCFISSLPPKVRNIAARLRNHWGIENSQHYVLDVTFGEDSSRIRKGTGPEISSVFRRLAPTILQRDTSIKDNIRGKRKRCSWEESQLAQLIQGFSRV